MISRRPKRSTICESALAAHGDVPPAEGSVTAAEVETNGDVVIACQRTRMLAGKAA